MPRRSCYWTRKLELDLVDFVREREFIWKPNGNTNHQIQQKYKAYAEFASRLGRGFTARSVRDRWVNIRSTYNHNLRRVDKSKETASSKDDIYVPCWPLWKPLQFLRTVGKHENGCEGLYSTLTEDLNLANNDQVKEELLASDVDDMISAKWRANQDEPQPEEIMLEIRQQGKQTNRPRRRLKTIVEKRTKKNKCKRVLDDLIKAMAPVTDITSVESSQTYWFLGKHVTERLNMMRENDAKCASNDILRVLQEFKSNTDELDPVINVTPVRFELGP